ncbi:MAG: hypothetical protein KGI54_13060 [Pseudomonadota bacterium]|nr:hypothetical protein [Pseudomonadota bacterium]
MDEIKNLCAKISWIQSNFLVFVVVMILMIIGYFSPIISATSITGTVSFALKEAGVYGLVILLLGIGLGIFQYLEPINKKHTVIAYGLTCMLFGMLAILWFASFSGLFDNKFIDGRLSTGFYGLLFGYGTITYRLYKKIMG